jgi:hypothetical protein
MHAKIRKLGWRGMSPNVPLSASEIEEDELSRRPEILSKVSELARFTSSSKILSFVSVIEQKETRH